MKRDDIIGMKLFETSKLSEFYLDRIAKCKYEDESPLQLAKAYTYKLYEIVEKYDRLLDACDSSSSSKKAPSSSASSSKIPLSPSTSTPHGGGASGGKYYTQLVNSASTSQFHLNSPSSSPFSPKSAYGTQESNASSSNSSSSSTSTIKPSVSTPSLNHYDSAAKSTTPLKATAAATTQSRQLKGSTNNLNNLNNNNNNNNNNNGNNINVSNGARYLRHQQQLHNSNSNKSQVKLMLRIASIYYDNYDDEGAYSGKAAAKSKTNSNYNNENVDYEQRDEAAASSGSSMASCHLDDTAATMDSFLLSTADAGSGSGQRFNPRYATSSSPLSTAASPHYRDFAQVESASSSSSGSGTKARSTRHAAAAAAYLNETAASSIYSTPGDISHHHHAHIGKSFSNMSKDSGVFPSEIYPAGLNNTTVGGGSSSVSGSVSSGHLSPNDQQPTHGSDARVDVDDVESTSDTCYHDDSTTSRDDDDDIPSEESDDVDSQMDATFEHSHNVDMHHEQQQTQQHSKPPSTSYSSGVNAATAAAAARSATAARSLHSPSSSSSSSSSASSSSSSSTTTINSSSNNNNNIYTRTPASVKATVAAINENDEFDTNHTYNKTYNNNNNNNNKQQLSTTRTARFNNALPPTTPTTTRLSTLGGSLQPQQQTRAGHLEIDMGDLDSTNMMSMMVVSNECDMNSAMESLKALSQQGKAKRRSDDNDTIGGGGTNVQTRYPSGVSSTNSSSSGGGGGKQSTATPSPSSSNSSDESAAASTRRGDDQPLDDDDEGETDSLNDMLHSSHGTLKSMSTGGGELFFNYNSSSMNVSMLDNIQAVNTRGDIDSMNTSILTFN